MLSLLGVCFATAAGATEADSTIASRHELREVVVTGFKQDNVKDAPVSVSTVGNRFIQDNELRGLREMST